MPALICLNIRNKVIDDSIVLQEVRLWPALFFLTGIVGMTEGTEFYMIAVC
jgi:hypothetical protein